ncbi:ABC transporter G family member 20 [Sarcoptes scabiei]|uniref:ABC transporter G family member 20 n=1 Tax=Sarcoptes scabiei TaxID=52283 RepID=A0A834R308_SARSC|nr:ABC transporter G family member 20 [Sarcoptes scabiei]
MMVTVDQDLNQIILELRSINFEHNVRTNPNESLKILDNISLTVRKAEIYGLLGASGCGKTSLLRLILGRISGYTGEVRLFNRVIDSLNKPLPHQIGYMPQDNVLYNDFNAIEMLTYFGSLYQIEAMRLKLQINRLMKLLELDQNKHSEKLISQLSGGQKRRVSLAIALLHEPKLLILDEPTVGVDPLLREVIWNHLKSLVSSRRNTVILTTHYIEESRNAHMIGFLRHGKLLIQAQPQWLLQHCRVRTMEEVFLQLCRDNDSWTRKISTDQSDFGLSDRLSAELVRSTTTMLIANTSNLFRNFVDSKTPRQSSKRKDLIKEKMLLTKAKLIEANNSEPASKLSNRPIKIEPLNKNNVHCSSAKHLICRSHLSTLIQKNLRQIYRNLSLLAFFILLPAIEMALIMLCIGRDITLVPIAVFNEERPDEDLSKVFLESFPTDSVALHQFDSYEEALDAVKQSKAAALLKFGKHFSSALRARFFSLNIDETNVDDSEIVSIWNDSPVFVQLDMSNQLIGLQIQRQLLNAFIDFAQKLAHSLGLSNNTFKPPITFGPPVYGIQKSAIVETFIAPGALIMIAFFATTIVTCHLLIHEIRQGLIERVLIAGVTCAEFLSSYIVIQSAILIIQLCLVFFTAFHIFEMPCLGSLPLSLSLICLQGWCGLMFGLMLSATCPDEIYATTLAIGTFFPSVIIGGIFWPIQSMPIFLQYLSQCLPSTQSISALRSILLRDWNLKHPSVSAAFFVSTTWLLAFLLCALHNFQRRI